MTSQERGDELLALYRARKHLPPEHRLDEAPLTGAELRDMGERTIAMVKDWVEGDSRRG